MLTTLIIQQQAALINIQTAKFTKFNDKDDPIKAKPPTSSIEINIVWVEYLEVKTLINDPPTKYPSALTKNMKENDVYDFPVA